MSRFADYLASTFDFTSAETEEIIRAMEKPLKKSIRVNTRKISLTDFKKHAKEQGWTLTDTDIPEVFLIDRDDTSLALGKTLEHTAGWFYIQEVAAAHPPFLLSQEIQKSWDISTTWLVLDMCAAPGGKTTQLADYFVESLVIANEVNRTRTPQLFENLDRMGYDNIAVVSSDGRFFQNFPDFFDAVLLDAPCSGEGTAFRDSSVIDHWHEKNITRIAKLQKQLFETAVAVTKPRGLLSYSTCTLNKEENENVIDSFQPAEKGMLKNLFKKRFWPHIEKTGGFFASIFQKKSSTISTHAYPQLAAQWQKNLIVHPATKWEWEIVERFISKHLKTTLKDGFLYISKDGVYFNSRNLGPLSQYFFFVHGGAHIGSIKGNTFTPTHHLWWYIAETSQIPEITITSEQWTIHQDHKKVSLEAEDGFYVLKYGRWAAGIVSIEKGILKAF